MSKYALVENGSIKEVRQSLPKNWNNISNFFVFADDLNELKTHGWYLIQKQEYNYNSETHRLTPAKYILRDDNVLEVREIIEKEKEEIENTEKNDYTFPILWQQIKERRDRLMKDFEWRYTRYYRQLRNEEELSDNLEDMDRYMKELSDITKQEDPSNIQWPTYNRQ